MIQKAAEFIYTYVLFFLPENKPHPWDYAAHFIISFTLVLIIFAALNKAFGVSFKSSLVAAIFATLMIGVVKECDDWRVGNTDIIADMAANLIGIGAIALILFFAHRLT